MNKRILTMLMLPVMTLALVSCEGGNNNDADDGGNSSGGDSNIGSEQEADTVLLKSITWNYGDEEDADMAVLHYNEENKLVKVVYSERVVNYTYVGSKVVETVDNEDDEYSFRNEYVVDSYGYVVAEQDSDDDEFKTQFSYSDGQLSSKKTANDELPLVSYVWESGNLIKVVDRDSEQELDITYSSKENKLGVHFPHDELFNYIFTDGVLLGFKGLSSKNLIDKVVVDGEEDEAITYEYEFNSDGYPIKVTEYYSADSYDQVILEYY